MAVPGPTDCSAAASAGNIASTAASPPWQIADNTASAGFFRASSTSMTNGTSSGVKMNGRSDGLMPPPSAGRLASSAAPLGAGIGADDSLGKPRSLPPVANMRPYQPATAGSG